jgi:myo-inositol-1-phosphate synthase
MPDIRVAIIGVGNCASALVQGAHYYKDSKEDSDVPGLLHVKLGDYHVSDIRFVAAFDVDERKVGKDLSEAIYSPPNNTKVFYKVPKLDVVVQKGPVLDGIGRYLEPVIKLNNDDPVDVASILRETKADMVLNYLPVGSEQATRWYAEQAIKAGCAFINCMPVFIASSPEWQERFRQANLPVAGDDAMSQIGATILHKSIMKMLAERGVKIDSSYQLNVGGDTDFLNMLERERLVSKKISKTEAVQAMVPHKLPLHIGPSDYIDFLANKKICYIWIEGRYFGDVPFTIDVKLDVWDAPNSAGVIIDAIRAVKIALDRGVSGPLTSISAYAFKHPPEHMSYEEAKRRVKEFVQGIRER